MLIRPDFWQNKKRAIKEVRLPTKSSMSLCRTKYNFLTHNTVVYTLQYVQKPIDTYQTNS